MLSDNSDLLLGIIGAAMIFGFAYWYVYKNK